MVEEDDRGGHVTALIIIVLILVCARLWHDVRALRSRLDQFESAHLPEQGPSEESAPLASSEPAEPETRPEWATAMVVVDEPPLNKTAAILAMEEPAELISADETHGEADDHEERSASLGFEDLFGRRLPIWAGGVTLAVAGILIVKYSIDAGLLSPLVRIILGGLFGAAMIAAAEAAMRGDQLVRDPRVRQALAGAGIATHYATILVAANVYQLIGPLTAFAGMALVTVVAGGLSLRFGAPSALLGLLGGLAAPALVGSEAPNVPLLASYLALTVGGLCALSRDQRWAWLGASALIGGFGWGLALLLGGALDAAASISLGLFILLLGIGFPLLLLAERGTAIRLAAGLVGCAQMAALVAVGGFAPLHWALFGLISIAMIWLSRRETGLRLLPSAGLAIALLLAGAWNDPSVSQLAIVIAAIVLIYAGSAVQRLWRNDGGLDDAAHVAAAAAAVLLVPMLHFYASPGATDLEFALLASLGSAISGTAAALGWRSPARKLDARFALLVAIGGALLVAAGALALPQWVVAPWGALVAGATLLLARRADDHRLEPIAWGFAALMLLLLLKGVTLDEVYRASGDAAPFSLGSAVRWLVPAAAALLFARAARSVHGGAIGQPFAVLFLYVAAAQLVPPVLLPLIPALLVALLGTLVRPTPTPALIASFGLLLLWAAAPLATWLNPALFSLAGQPFLAPRLPNLSDTVLRLAVPAFAILAAIRRAELVASVRVVAISSAALLAAVAAHIVFKQFFALDSTARFIALGLAERTVWEAALAAGAVAAWRTGSSRLATALATASLLHFAWFTLLLHNPLWSAQSVGMWLVPAYGIALALLHLGGRAEVPAKFDRARAWGQILLIPMLVISLLRQFFAGALLTTGEVGSAEDIIRSLLGALIAIAYLQWGIRRSARDWRIASLILMLGTVAKVFLFDANGLDGLLRVASFAALGFSLIGLGWLYSRHLPDPANAIRR